MAKEFVNGIVAKEVPQLSWIVAKLNINVEEFKQFLEEKQPNIKNNNGWLTVNVLRSKAGDKIYCQYDDWKPKDPVTAADHSPDRQDDMPF
mgnify:FL=1|tara:strand:+ start:383 stop:655 length:273 start_codon:yes stop_codon:yes gene_type:complete